MKHFKETNLSRIVKELNKSKKEMTSRELSKILGMDNRIVSVNLSHLNKRGMVLCRVEYEKNKWKSKPTGYFKLNEKMREEINFWVENY